MNTIIINSITIIFVIVILLYATKNIIINICMYNFIKDEYCKLNEENYLNSTYLNIKQMYDTYTKDNSFIFTDLSSLLEEAITSYNYKNKSMLSKIKKVKKTSTICILLGVLGTFTGLLTLLMAIYPNDLVKILPSVISSMQTAFISSICGILCSIVINYFIDTHDCELTLTQLFLKIENLLNAEVSHCINLKKINRFDTIDSTLKEINTTTIGLQEFKTFFINVDNYNKEFLYGVENLKEILNKSNISIKSYETNINKLDKQFSLLNIKLALILDILEGQDSINKETIYNLKEMAKNISETTEIQHKVKEYIKYVSESVGSYDKSIHDLIFTLMNEEIDSNKLKDDSFKNTYNEEIYEIEEFVKENIHQTNGDDFNHD